MSGLAQTWMSPVSDQQAAQWLQSYPGKEQASLSDPFEATAQTVRYMVRLIQHSLSDPIIGQAWRDAQQRFGALTGNSPAQCAWWYAKTVLTFVHHQKLLQAWLGRSDELQLLISPEAVLKMKDPKGDCAVYTTLICALLSIAGVKWEIVTVAVNPYEPGIFSHVYPRAVLPDGRRIALDASHGKYPGWEVPKERVSKKQVWSESGSPIEDLDSGYRGLGDAPIGVVLTGPMGVIQSAHNACDDFAHRYNDQTGRCEVDARQLAVNVFWSPLRLIGVRDPGLGGLGYIPILAALWFGAGYLVYKALK